jgi:metal-responsive CopG/Arc/MetJ family transcriptional regulator
MVRKPQKKPKRRVLLNLEVELVERIESFQHANRISNRSQAIRWLLDFALRRNPKVKPQP